MFARLHLIFKNAISYFLLIPLLLFQGCSHKQEPVHLANCGINGLVEVSSLGHPNGVQVTLESTSDESVKHVAITNTEGYFYFRDLEPDTYLISAEKEGYEMDYIRLEKSTLGSNNPPKITLVENETREITIHMSTKHINEYEQLSVTDMSGNPLKRITISHGATTIYLRLFNGTSTKQDWKLRYEDCFGTIRFLPVYYFSSFNITEGKLAPGDNVVLVGYVNPEIYSSEFEIVYGLNVINIDAGITRISMGIDFE